MSTIALLSDFGTKDWFVAEMKGVILSIAPKSVIVDITHEITPGDIQSAAFVLLACTKSFSVGTIFCIGVDPGSNTYCPIIVLKTDDYFFISPDNGVLSWVIQDRKHSEIHQCVNNDLFHFPSPSTFRGRDIIAPVAAHIANKTPLAQFGPTYKITNYIEFPTVHSDGSTYQSEIIYIDHFGNVVTGIRNDKLPVQPYNSTSITVAKNNFKIPVEQYYDQVSPGNLLVYPGSAGFLEIAVNGKKASEMLNVSVGDVIKVDFFK